LNPNDLDQASYVHPLIILAMVVAGALMLLLPRRRVIIPFLSAGILIPLDQVLLVGPFHFQMLRVLILFGWIAAIKNKVGSGTSFLATKINTLDKLVILFVVFDAVDYIILRDFSGQAFVNRFGAVYTVVGIYFLLRALIRNERDIVLVLKVLACVSAIVAGTMVVEHITKQNPYVFLGGSRAWTRQLLMVRDEKLRAMGPFQHPILAGTFGGISLPLFIALWLRGSRSYAVVGAVSATIIVLASASSTPILGYGLGLLAIACWPMREQMRTIRWGIVAALVALHLLMKAPVWALIQRVDIVGGSSGFHRYYLVDQFIRRFWDWCLLGIKDTDTWGAFMWDHANQYVAVGTTAGILPLAFFISILVLGFSRLGTARKRADDKRDRMVLWVLGAALFADVVSFFGISYVDQIMLVWWGLIAIIQAATAPISKARLKNEVTVELRCFQETDFAEPGLWSE
jgi:hypothetical protein